MAVVCDDVGAVDANVAGFGVERRSGGCELRGGMWEGLGGTREKIGGVFFSLNPI